MAALVNFLPVVLPTFLVMFFRKAGAAAGAVDYFGDCYRNIGPCCTIEAREADGFRTRLMTFLGGDARKLDMVSYMSLLLVSYC